MNASTRSRPLALARYIAASASRSRSSAVSPTAEFTAKPMLAVTTSSWPSITIGSRTHRRNRSATAAGSTSTARGVLADRSTTRSTNTTNSSPPNRANRSRVAHHAAESRGDLAQQFVADAVPEAVVDDLEVVEVDEQHRDLTRLGSREQCVESFDQRRPIGQLGQIVVGGGVREQLGGPALLGDVFDVGDRQGSHRRPR